jgi:hypothetical protein
VEVIQGCYVVRGHTSSHYAKQLALQAALDWSYELLPEPERVVLRRLAIFAGGFTLEAATAIGASAESPEIAALELEQHGGEIRENRGDAPQVAGRTEHLEEQRHDGTDDEGENRT